MVNKYIRTILFFALFLIAGDLMAQVPPPKPGDLPIDGGLFALIALALGYGVKKIHDISKK